MDKGELIKILDSVSKGEVSPEKAAAYFKAQPFEDLGFAKPDHHRAIRQGEGEVIYGAGKTPEQIVEIAGSLMKNGQKRVLITRMDKAAFEYAKERTDIEYFENANLLGYT